jgi:hypothetical protein
MKDMTKQSRNKNRSQYDQQKISQPKFPRIQHPGSPLAPWPNATFILPLIGKGREREMAPRPVAGPSSSVAQIGRRDHLPRGDGKLAVLVAVLRFGQPGRANKVLC